MTQIKKAFSTGNKPNEVVSVKDFGAVGDGVTDDTVAIQAALDSAVTNNRKLIFLAGNYRTTQTITFAADGLNVEFVGGSSIKPDSSVLIGAQVGSGSAPYPTRMNLKGIKVDRTTYSGATENIGFNFLECNQSTFENFESRFSKYNFQFSPATAGCAYNTFINPQGIGGFYNFRGFASGTGFFNENTFLGGRGFVTTDTDTNLLFGNNGGQCDHNKVYGMSLEGNARAIYTNGSSNFFSFPRTEGSTTDVQFDATSQYNMVISSRVDLSVTDTGTRNQYITFGSGAKFVTGNNDVTTMQIDRLGANTASNPAVVVNDTFSSSGNSYINEWRHGRDNDASYVFKSIRDSDGLVRSSLTTNGKLFLAIQLDIDQAGWNFEPLKMANHVMWIDSQDRMIIKGASPSSESDGTSVGLGNTQTTVGAAGGASALPATPTGYTKIMIGGTEYVMPYYAQS